MESERNCSTEIVVLATVADSCEKVALRGFVVSWARSEYHDKDNVEREGSAFDAGGKQGDPRVLDLYQRGDGSHDSIRRRVWLRERSLHTHD